MAADLQEPESPQVVLYALSTCSHCKAVKRLFDRLDIAYGKVDVDLLDRDSRKHALARLRRYSSRVAFPTTVIDGEAIVGNKPQTIQARLDDPSKTER